MKYLGLFALTTLLIQEATCTVGVDISQSYGSNVFSCFKSNGYSFAIPRAYYSYGAPDAHVRTNIDNAWAGGMAHVDVYMFPCRSKGAEAQVVQMLDNLAGKSFGTVWV